MAQNNLADPPGQIQALSSFEGKILVALPENFLNTFNELLSYYKENEEAKKTTAQAAEDAKTDYVSPDQLAEELQVTARTIRKWCKGLFAPAVSNREASQRIRIDRKLALELYRNRDYALHSVKQLQ